MKNIGICTALAVLGLSVLCAFADLNLIDHPFTITAATTNTLTSTSVQGEPVYISVSAPTNCSVTVATVDGYGMSIGGARTLFSAASVMTTNKVLSSLGHLKQDRVATTIEYTDTNATGTVQVKILFKTE